MIKYKLVKYTNTNTNIDTNIVTVEDNLKRECGGCQALPAAGRVMGRALITSVSLLFLINPS